MSALKICAGKNRCIDEPPFREQAQWNRMMNAGAASGDRTQKQFVGQCNTSNMQHINNP
jgi:hypothetical protein